jgi:hypothetical protein
MPRDLRPEEGYPNGGRAGGVVSACDEDEDEMPTTLGRADAGKDEDDDVPGFYVPDPEVQP